VVFISGCDTTSGAPALPTGAHWLSSSVVSEYGLAPQPNHANPSDTRSPESILAATTLVEIRSAALAAAAPLPALSPCETDLDVADPCWTKANDPGGLLFLAVATPGQCRATKDKVALGGSTLYFIHWIGNSPGEGFCQAAIGGTGYRLFTVPMSSLPKTGTLSVELVVQDQRYGTTVADTSQVELG
jgi:hypothetical protein